MRAVMAAGICVAVVATPAAANPPWPGDEVGPTARTAAVAKRIERLIPRRMDRSALGRNVSITVVDTATGEDVFNRHAQRGLAGASNTKLVTSLLTLQALGPSHRVPTVVRRVGPRKIALVGGGDSLLGSGNVRGLARRTAASLKRDGVRRVQVRVDASLYKWHGPAPGWASYEVGSNIGRVEPLNMNDARTGDGPRYAGTYFTSQLRVRGIRARYAGRRASRDAARVLARYRGHTVKSIVRAALLPSDSDDAEALSRLAALGRGFPPTYEGWWRAAKSVIDDIGLDRRGIRLYDAPGSRSETA